ncbi:Hypothetical predicted protein [Mytilus galloprovincialis]|uniref:Mab-21-like HhH/H2TH-like domain-containing protein n=1 Tax=Mytilus galloprovincialis TaxID=29158 RepID=A0A8B6F3D6_MYTGA|nr:Hypothetical predicted protein [Mytilus galloprovincialis]
MDTMYIDYNFKVYESETDVIPDGITIPLIMSTEETEPCFAQLRRQGRPQPNQVDLKHLWVNNNLGCMLSSKRYILFCLWLSAPYGVKHKIHGPCITDINEVFDLAMCLKCDKWICQAQPWVYRSRTAWPKPEIISKIISFGVLFVPIGCKGSIHENLEWRISFSVAEKFLIYSFNHTQLLCYALLKIFLKEIVERNADLKGLLCSYFLKTLMCWILEETDQALWRPDNIIPCFMACLQRLLYYVRYSNLPHYFIPEKDLFYSRFNVMNKHRLEIILK